MKRIVKLLFILIGFLLLSRWSSGQGLRLNLTTEKSVFGIQSGVEINYGFKNYLSIGGFYQKEPHQIKETQSGQNEFTGISLGIPIARCEKLLIRGMLRAGLSNRRFVIITPSLETELILNRRLSFGMGLGIRATEAAINGKLMLKI